MRAFLFYSCHTPISRSYDSNITAIRDPYQIIRAHVILVHDSAESQLDRVQWGREVNGIVEALSSEGEAGSRRISRRSFNGDSQSISLKILSEVVGHEIPFSTTWIDDNSTPGAARLITSGVAVDALAVIVGDMEVDPIPEACQVCSRFCELEVYLLAAFAGFLTASGEVGNSN